MFGTIANLSTGGVPQPLFYLAGTAVWTFFSSCINKVSGTFTTNSNIFSKVYFPRLAMPISTMLSGFINFLVQFVMFFCLLLFYVVRGEVALNWATMPLLLPIVLQVGLLGLGCGIIVSSVTTRYRDLMVVVTFGVQLWMYGTPVVYPLSMIVQPLLRAVMIANPMTAPMESFRAVCFNSGEVSVLMWVVSLAWTVLLLGGISLFGKVEKTLSIRFDGRYGMENQELMIRAGRWRAGIAWARSAAVHCAAICKSWLASQARQGRPQYLDWHRPTAGGHHLYGAQRRQLTVNKERPWVSSAPTARASPRC